MKHDSQIDNKTRLIYCTLEGEFDIEESVRLSKDLREKAVELDFNVLYDARNLQEPKSITPVHDFTAKLSSVIDSTAHRKVKVAFLYAPGNYDNFWQFYEESSVARGLVIKIFTDKEAALNWLSHSVV